MRELINKKGILFFVGAVLCCLFIVGGYYLDVLLETGSLFEIVSKVIIIFLSLYLIKKVNPKYKIECKNNQKIARYIVMITIPLTICFVCFFGKVDKSISFISFISLFLGVFTTALWEELFFRELGICLYIKNKKIKGKVVGFVVLVFGISHLFNILRGVDSWSLFVCHTVLLTSLSYFLYILSWKIDTIFVPLVFHILFDFITEFFVEYSSNAMSIGSTLFYILCSVNCVLFILFGLIVSKNKIYKKDSKNESVHI